MANIGGIHFNVLSESRPHTSDITQYAVEDGSDITDHVRLNSKSYNIRGFVGDDENPAKVHLKLAQLMAKRELVDYKGRATLKNCIIENFTPDVDSSSLHGFRFSLKITQVKISKPSTVSLLPVNLRVDIAEIENAGRVQVK